MAIKSGFYDSLNGDRKYDSVDFGMVFDGVISDGVFANKDGGLRVTNDTTGTGIQRGVKVNPGKCWFNHTFVTVDAPEGIVINPPDTVNFRVDVIIVEVDRSPSVRGASIKVLQGEDKQTLNAAKKAIPVLKREGDFGCNQYALAEVDIYPNVSTIRPSDIRDQRGYTTPYSVGLVDQIKATALIDQWDAEYGSEITRFNNIFNNLESMMTSRISQFETIFNESQTDRTDDFNAWFDRMKGQLTTDAAGNLQRQIDNTNGEIESINQQLPYKHEWKISSSNQNNPPSDIYSVVDFSIAFNCTSYSFHIKRYGNVVSIYCSFTWDSTIVESVKQFFKLMPADETNPNNAEYLKLRPFDYVCAKLYRNGDGEDCPIVWIDKDGVAKMYASSTRKIEIGKIYYFSITYISQG